MGQEPCVWKINSTQGLMTAGKKENRKAEARETHTYHFLTAQMCASVPFYSCLGVCVCERTILDDMKIVAFTAGWENNNVVCVFMMIFCLWGEPKEFCLMYFSLLFDNDINKPFVQSLAYSKAIKKNGCFKYSQGIMSSVSFGQTRASVFSSRNGRRTRWSDHKHKAQKYGWGHLPSLGRHMNQHWEEMCLLCWQQVQILVLQNY